MMRLPIRVERESADPSSSNKKPDFRASINPWKLMRLSKEKALMAAEKARERIAKRAPMAESEPSKTLEPLPSETKCGPSMNPGKENNAQASSPIVVSKGWLGGTTRLFSSPRRRFSGSPTAFTAVVASPNKNYYSNFDLKLTGVSRELDTSFSLFLLLISSCCPRKKNFRDEESSSLAPIPNPSPRLPLATSLSRARTLPLAASSLDASPRCASFPSHRLHAFRCLLFPIQSSPSCLSLFTHSGSHFRNPNPRKDMKERSPEEMKKSGGEDEACQWGRGCGIDSLLQS
ncbi:hypothetical protein MRB53_006018 [Persea americana]|uniref:Uncharacterized protein n=1 Tax=Persea americana TaxID=3435 RepID=A0ACC2MFP1_PERAE|nr:hypothetical protein MRB53_006018 [Persea americana]